MVSRPVAVALATVYLVWSSTYYALRVAVEALPALTMAGSRYLLAGTVLFRAGPLTRRGLAHARAVAVVAAAGGTAVPDGNGFVAIAEVKLSSSLAAVAGGAMPIIAALMAPLFKERSRRGEWLGMGLGLSGVAVLAFSHEVRTELGAAALLLVAPTAWAAGSMLARKVPVAGGMLAPATQMIAGGALLVTAGALRREHVPARFPPSAVFAFFYLAVLGSLVGFSAYSYLLKSTRPALAMSYSYVNPPIAVLIGAALGREHVGPEMVGAVALIGAGTFALLRAART